MSALPASLPLSWTPRKPPAVAQYNWITGGVDVVPEQTGVATAAGR